MNIIKVWYRAYKTRNNIDIRQSKSFSEKFKIKIHTVAYCENCGLLHFSNGISLKLRDKLTKQLDKVIKYKVKNKRNEIIVILGD